MTEPLQTALHDEADGCPEFDLTTDPWARGRRVRRARRVAGVVGGVAALAMATVVAVGGLPEWSADPVSPVEPSPGLTEPTIPDRLYKMPHNMTDLADSPLGEPAAVAYADQIRVGFRVEEDVPVVVGAYVDEVRAVRSLAGTIRGLVLSPDGTKLAGFGFGEGVRVIDVQTGELVTLEVPSAAVHLLWTPDGTKLAGGSWGMYGSQGRDGLLDLTTGEWQPRRYAAPIAFSPDGQYELRWDEDNEHWVIGEVDGRAIAVLSLDESVQYEVRSGVFSPDGTKVAVTYLRTTGSGAIGVFDVETGESAGLFSHDRWSEPLLVGWGERGVLVRTEDVHSEFPAEDAAINLIPWRRNGWGDYEPIIGGTPTANGGADYTYFPWAISIAADFWDAKIRTAAEPDAPFDWFPWLVMAAIAAAVLLILQTISWIRSLRNRRLGRPPGVAT